MKKLMQLTALLLVLAMLLPTLVGCFGSGGDGGDVTTTEPPETEAPEVIWRCLNTTRTPRRYGWEDTLITAASDSGEIPPR